MGNRTQTVYLEAFCASRAPLLQPLSALPRRAENAKSKATHPRRVPLTLDERFRLSIPQNLVELPTGENPRCILAKERAGCLSLWSAEAWEEELNARIKLVEQKLQAESFGDDRIAQVQLLGRLLSTRHRPVELRGRGRLPIPEGFRKFLGVERDPPDNQVLVVGAAVCIEIWKPAAWLAYLEQRMPSSAACSIALALGRVASSSPLAQPPCWDGDQA